MSPARGLLVEIGAAYAMLFTLTALGRTTRIRPEWVRNLAHACTSLLALTYPAVLKEGWAVVAMCGVILAHVLAIREWRPAKDHFGVILGGLEATSWGDIFLPVAIAATFFLAQGDWILFSVPVLILALADPVAAVVGNRFGKLRYPTLEGTKSFEGSGAFFAVAFCSAFAMLAAFSETSLPVAASISAALGLAATLVECVTWRGIDNLTVPIASCLVLQAFRGLRLWA
ncbi:MAG: hypothetical protein HY553_04805 [Elusimicrobia bacterium]|nr:hypothetical protein [Elusimicrobiota bacterium]